MGKTGISYVDKTWNFITGCTTIRPGCAHCWALEVSKKIAATGKNPYYAKAVSASGKWSNNITTIEDKIKEPMKWRKHQRIFAASTSDIFHKNVPITTFVKAYEVMNAANQHDYFLLTKRFDLAAMKLHVINGLKPQDHIFVGFSICDERDAEEALPYLFNIANMGWRTFVSYEPALGPVDWKYYTDIVGWLIGGAESGPNRRAFDWRWLDSANMWAHKYNIPFYCKQGSCLAPECKGNIPNRLWKVKEFPSVIRTEHPKPVQLSF